MTDWEKFWRGNHETPIRCPECGAKVSYGVDAWGDDGYPVDVSFDCPGDEWYIDDDADESHYYRQSDWQEIRDALEALAILKWKRMKDPTP